jgi:hypothetical protein
MPIEINLSEVNPTLRPRDAIHVAVVQVIAKEPLKAGQRVGIIGISYYRNGEYIPSAWSTENCGLYHGIVSPFIDPDLTITNGDVFWVIMKPSSVTDLRHAWSHASLPEDSSTNTDDYDDECRGCNG